MTYITLLLLIFNVADSQKSEERCLKLFDKQKFSKLIKACSNKDEKTTRLKLALLTAEFFQKVSYRRINEIFHHGNGGRDIYELVFKKNLLTKFEENAINEYYGQFKKYADLNESIAQVITAKLFYIIEYILKNTKDANFDESEFQKKKQKVYINNLNKYIKTFPDDPEVLYLLGVEGVTYASSPYQNEVQLFKIKNQHYYDLLLKANKLKYPKAQRYIDGVETFKKHMERVKKEAQNNDPVALFELGINLYDKEKGNQENINKAIQYFTRAAEQNHIQSLKWLTHIYSQDFPDTSNYLKALNRLIELNDSDSMLELGDLYLCNKKIKKAKKLYEQAKSLNNPLAQIALEDLKYDGEPSQGCGR